MTKNQTTIIMAFVEHNMRITETARALYYHRNTVIYHMDKVKHDTGLDPRIFPELLELIPMAREVVEHGD